MIDRATLDLFRRHVPYRAHHDTGASVDASRRYVCLGFGAFNLRQLGYSKVENLYAAIFRDENVVGFQVTMHDSFLMRGGKTAGDLARVVYRSTLCQRHPSHPLAHGLALEQLRDNIGRTIMRADV